MDTPAPAKKRRFNYRLRGSFLSVLLLVQALMVALSFAFTRLMVDNLQESENRRTQSIAKHIQNEVRQRIYRSRLVTLNIATDPETVEAFRRRDRDALLKVAGETWKQLQGHNVTQFHFHVPTPQGIVSFLRVHRPDIYGEEVSSYRPMVVKCHLEKKAVSGLEQGKSGYGFRACVPVFYKDQFLGSVEVGNGFNERFFKSLNDDYEGRWSLINLDKGVTTIFEDKTVLLSYNQTDQESLTAAQRLPAETLDQIKQGTPNHRIDDKSESVVLNVPIKNFSGDNALYISFQYQTKYFARIRYIVAMAGLICLAGLLLSGAILLVLYRQVTRPIHELVVETGKIKSFNLDEKVDIRASLFEIRTLVEAVANMKVGLQSFKKFVPSQLVRQLVESGMEANTTGKRREVTVLFTDVADFTSISESMRPSALSAHLSEYFDELTRIIMECHGTVDKYIGDAIMAFWNAPVEMADHARLACQATLLIDRRLAELEKKWAAEGKPALRTRLGLNTGEVVVGNMGSDQRLNYTVIGDAVNLASRLESLNKYYGSTIIVSRFTRDQCAGDFEFRTLDYVLVKGKIKAVSIYELVAERGDISTVDREYLLYYEEAVALHLRREWAKASEIFARLAEEKPGDGPCRMFARRCQEYQASPPPEGWTGEYTHEQK